MTPELISSAVLAALTVAGKAGLTEATKKAAADAYDALKSLVHARFGSGSEPAQAIARLEANPASTSRKDTLTEELDRAGVAADPQLASAAQTLLDLLKSLPHSEQHIQSAHGTDIALADRGGTASVTHYAPPRHD